VKSMEERDSTWCQTLSIATASIKRAVDALPASEPDFLYSFIPEEVVDVHDGFNNLLVFATRMDEILFPHDRHRKLMERDPVKVKWLFELLAHRRKMSLGKDKNERLKQVKNRLNSNVWAYNNKRKSAAPPRTLSRGNQGRFTKSHPT
ncbi:hypothetical protein PFISCL1PPCAC_6808, partial [Pristionchus fissidentatus]